MINGSDRGGGFIGDDTDLVGDLVGVLVGDLVGKDFVGELCLDVELGRRKGVLFSLAVNT